MLHHKNSFKRVQLMFGILYLFLIIAYYWDITPDLVCAHFDFNGHCDRKMSKSILFLNPIIAFVLILMIEYTIKHPEYLNLPIKNENSIKNALLFLVVCQYLIIFLCCFLLCISYQTTDIHFFQVGKYLGMLILLPLVIRAVLRFQLN